MAEKFGNTWWGQSWLNSLEHVDYENRLPRGASYARAGKVQSLKITDNTIVAKVRGSRPTPYKVTIIVPPFFENDINRLMDEIIRRPALISKLLNRELDPEILNIAQSLGLKVFPRQWTDFKMSCSCPDWAVPCKHLASVIYMISREIDNNPFLVFSIHNVNLPEELKKRGIVVESTTNAEVPLFASLLVPLQKNAHQNQISEAVVHIDYSQLEDTTDALIQLLPDNPPFYPSGNFREKYAIQLRRVQKAAKRMLSKNLLPDAVFGKVPEKAITHRTTLSLSIDGDGACPVYGLTGKLSLAKLCAALLSLHPDFIHDYDPTVEALYKVMQAAQHLTANGMVVPQIVQYDNKKFGIRWLPAQMDVRVRNVIDKLSKQLPADLLLFSTTVRNKEKTVSLENQTIELLSIFIGQLVEALAKDNFDRFESLFFLDMRLSFNGIGESSLSGGIKVWLDRYALTTETYKPVIAVHECDHSDEFDVDISIEDCTKPDSLPIWLSQILQQKQYDRQRYKILQSLSLLTPFIHGLDNHINDGGVKPIRFTNKQFAPFLMDILPAIRLLNIRILLPKALQALLRPKVSVKISRNKDSQGLISLSDLLSFDWRVALGDQIVKASEFDRLIKDANRLFKLKENYIYVTNEDIEKIHKALAVQKPLTPFEMLQTALAEEYEGAPIELTSEVRDLIRELTANELIALPSTLNATLRPYQQRGYSWMYRNSRIGFGSIIADDMGLGKTLQVISVLLKYKEEGAINKNHRALVIVPTGLLTNWQAEVTKFAPDLTTLIYHGTARDLKTFDADVMLTTYGVLRSDHELLKKKKWFVVIVDEAQNIKNYETAQAKAVKSIPANIRIAMSGTPVENRLREFWSIMDFANKGYLGNAKHFKEHFAQPIQVFNDEKAVSKFRRITAPFMMRRMKSDKSIISDLPDKIEQNQFALLTASQAALYQETMQAAMREIEGVAENGDQKTLFKRQGLVLQMILALKQICNHPTQFLKNQKYDATLSGKVELLMELLESIMESGEKVLVFTQFKEMGDLLVRFIEEHFGDTPLFYHGGCTLKQREEMINRFQNNRADKIFILSLKAAGTGLNLTAASHVIHYDLWWNPAVESQATDRAYRIGQQKNVMVHRMICKNTFEEKIDKMIQQKKNLAEMTVSTGENWIGKLSNKELREIFG